MAGFLIYFIRWAVVLTMLYSLYGIFMKRETLHALNRVVLMAVLVVSMVLPLVQLETRQGNIVAERCERFEQGILELQTPTVSLPSTQSNATFCLQRREGVKSVTTFCLVLIYLLGVFIAWFRYLWSLASLLVLIHRGKRIDIDALPKGIVVIAHPAIKTPCSWMHWVLLSEGDVQTRPVISHELAHIRLGHSWDMLICELTCRMLWCVPFAWMLRQDLRDVHEFQADCCVLQSGIDENEYQLLLIRKATGTGLQPVVNALNQSPIKRRFKMMYKKPSRRWVALKAAYLLPLSALALVAFARPQTMGEIEKQVEATAPAIAEAVKSVKQQLPSFQRSDTPDSPLTASESVECPNPAQSPIEQVRDSVEMADGNLVKADLAESGHASTYREKSVVELLDSTMQAVGARKIADGTYLGHFQPNLNSDTVRIAKATVLDRDSKQTGEHQFAQNAADPYAYNITLNGETRKERKGYYIRFLQPVSSTLRHYDKKQVDPLMLSTDSVLTGRSSNHLLSMKPVAIEQNKQETRLFLYTGFGGNPQVEMLKQQNYNFHHDMAIVDELSGDKYVCRSIDYSYFKYVKDESVGKDTIKVYQTCLVFPPLGKRVKEIHIGRIDNNGRYTSTFNLNDIPRKGIIITN